MRDTADISKEVGRILAEADADVAARKPVCRASGRCCKFEAYGHRLYVTAAEVIYFSKMHMRAEPRTKKGAAVVSLPQFFARRTVEGCPYHVEGLCTAREARPLGCRIYFCDANAQSWQNEVYEKYHGQIKELHAKFEVPYRYMEWREALRELAAAGES